MNNYYCNSWFLPQIFNFKIRYTYFASEALVVYIVHLCLFKIYINGKGNLDLTRTQGIGDLLDVVNARYVCSIVFQILCSKKIVNNPTRNTCVKCYTGLKTMMHLWFQFSNYCTYNLFLMCALENTLSNLNL